MTIQSTEAVPVFSKPCAGGCEMPLYWNQRPGTERDESRRSDKCGPCEAGQPPILWRERLKKDWRLRYWRDQRGTS